MLPMSAYTAYFMPETTYAFLFAVLTWLMLALLPAHVAVGSTLSGVVVGTMLLIKPHALALFLAVLATLAALAVAPHQHPPPSTNAPRRRRAVRGSDLCHRRRAERRS